VLITVGLWIGLPAPLGLLPQLFRRPLSKITGGSDELRAPRTYHAFVFEPPVNREIISPLVLGSQLFQEG
jgi:hypothetical protein